VGALVGVGVGEGVGVVGDTGPKFGGIGVGVNMIRSSQKFQNYQKKIPFVTEDTRNMKLFKDNSFDFVLFSWCGIDFVAGNRQKILHEIRRVIKK